MTIGIIAAMEKEADKIIAAMTDKASETVGGICFTSGFYLRRKLKTFLKTLTISVCSTKRQATAKSLRNG